MKKLVQSSQIKGTIAAPSSKSYLQRAVACALLSQGESWLYNVTDSDDYRASLNAAVALGAEIETDNTTIRISGKNFIKSDTIDCKEAGLTLRMFTPIAALFYKEITLNGSGSLLKRPFNFIEFPLRMLGASIETNNGLLPIKVRGPLKGGHAIVDGSISSQFITGLMIALPCCEKDSVITVTSMKSKPYLDMTIDMLDQFCVEIKTVNNMEFHIPGRQNFVPAAVNIEGDWSGAAFHLVAGAVGGKAVVQNLSMQSYQGDKNIVDVLIECGAGVMVKKNEITVVKKSLKPFEFDATDCPDLFPPIAVLAANCNGTSVIKGAERLKFKESDRALVLKKEFAKAGININIDGDIMEITGGKIKSCVINSNNDHRIAMAAAILGINAEGPIEIDNAEAVSKSYPSFYEDYIALGGSCE